MLWTSVYSSRHGCYRHCAHLACVGFLCRSLSSERLRQLFRLEPTIFIGVPLPKGVGLGPGAEKCFIQKKGWKSCFFSFPREDLTCPKSLSTIIATFSSEITCFFCDVEKSGCWPLTARRPLNTLQEMTELDVFVCFWFVHADCWRMMSICCTTTPHH